MDSHWTDIPGIITAAATNRYGLLALMVIVVSLLAYRFFSDAPMPVRIGIFLLVFFGTVAFGAVVVKEAQTYVPPPTADKGSGEDRRTLRVSFEQITVLRDCHPEPDVAGWFYYSFKVNDETVVDRPRDNVVEVGSGQVIALNSVRTLQLPARSGERLTVSGFVREGEDTAAHDNDLGHFVHDYLYDDDGWRPGIKDIELRKSDDCRARVRYRIEVF